MTLWLHTDPSEQRSRNVLLVRKAFALLFAAVIGWIVLILDERLQPRLNQWGQEYQLLLLIAGYWQQLGEWPGIALCLIAPFLFLGTRRTATACHFAVSLAATGIAAQLVKHLCGRARPNAVGDLSLFFGPLATIRMGVDVQVDSMPSGHTAAAFCMAHLLARTWPRLRYAWWLPATGVGAARTLVDRHFPSDVIFGALLGILIAELISARVEVDGPKVCLTDA